MKYYAVKKGRETGIFTTWPECQRQTKGFSGAEFKSFQNKNEALEYLQLEESLTFYNIEELKNVENYAFTDGSFDVSQGVAGWGYVIKLQGEPQREYSGRLRSTSGQVAGELAAVTSAIEDALEAGKTSLTIYHDYIGVERWATGKWSALKEIATSYKYFIETLPKGFSLKFVHVPAHSGVPLNERADQLAREALTTVD